MMYSCPFFHLKPVKRFPERFKIVETWRICMLQLPHEILMVIFERIDDPKHLSMTCRSLNAIFRDPDVIASWLLCDPYGWLRVYRCIRLALEIPVLEQLLASMFELIYRSEKFNVNGSLVSVRHFQIGLKNSSTTSLTVP